MITEPEVPEEEEDDEDEDEDKPKCEHVIDWSSARPADGADGIIDVWCWKCNTSGSSRIDPEDIQWE